MNVISILKLLMLLFLVLFLKRHLLLAKHVLFFLTYILTLMSAFIMFPDFSFLVVLMGGQMSSVLHVSSMDQLMTSGLMSFPS